MNPNLITYTGKIVFDPPHKTTKHKLQGTWKRVAYIDFGKDICEYYSWFLEKRFGLILNKPIRNFHVTFINDRFMDFSGNDELEKENIYNVVKNKWNGKEISVILTTGVFSNGESWWLNVDHEHRSEINSIRSELGLGKSFFGLHATIGRTKENQLEYSEYLVRMHKNKFILLNEY